MSDKDLFQLSIPAQNVEAKFYNKRGIVYVEGDDDIVFWSQYFKPEAFEFRPMNGCNNLADIEYKIIHNGLKCIVAKDADYSAYLPITNKHPLIVCTLSHSIECVMYCPYNINAYLKRLAKCLDNHVDDIMDLYDKFCDDTKELVLYDIANNIYGLGQSVCGDSCIPIMQSNTSVKVSSDKVKSAIDKLKKTITSDKVELVRRLVDGDSRHMRQITKGHFQTSFVINMLKHLSSKYGNNGVSLSKDALYAMLVICFPDCENDCKERKVIKNRVMAAINAL